MYQAKTKGTMENCSILNTQQLQQRFPKTNV